MKYLSFEKIDAIMFDLKEGSNIARISRKHGVSRPTIYKLEYEEGSTYQRWKDEWDRLEEYRWENRDEIMTSPHTGKKYRAIYEEIV